MRPTCVHCGKSYGRRSTFDVVLRRADRSDPWPPHTGSEVVVKDVINNNATVMYRTLWDGSTWYTPYHPFCKLRCALDYARQAYIRFGKRNAA